MKPNDILLTIAAFVAMTCLLPSCSTTRRIPDGEQRYTGRSISVDGYDGAAVPDGVKTAVDEAVDVKSSNAVWWKRYPLPIGLWVYNNWPNPPKGLKHWIYEKLSEDPVLVSDVRPELRVRMIDDILDNNGYFRGKADYRIDTARNVKKASVKYMVSTGPAYLLDSIELLPDTTRLCHIIDSIASRSPYLQRGQRYCTDSLSVERTRIANSVRNRGYYFFRPDYIEYLADSLMNPGHIALRLTLASNAPQWALRHYRVGQVTTRVYRNGGGGEPDTVETSRGRLIQMMPSRLRRQLIPECVTFKSGRTFSVRDMNRTQTYLSRLGIFNSITIDVVPDTLQGRRDLLDVNIDCTFDRPLEARVEVNASSKSNSYIGPGVTLGLTNRNLFGGGELLSVTLTGSYEWQTGHDRRSVFNSYEVGLSGSLSFPRLLVPRFVRRSRRNLNWTRITLNADLLNRPHYFRMAQFNASFNYDWQSGRYSTRTLTPLKLTYTKLLNTTHDFDSIMAANPAVAQSFKSQFVPQIAYTYLYDRAIDSDNTINWTYTLQEAGNVCWALWRAAGIKGEKRLFGMPFSQFLKASTQLVYGRQVARDHWIVSRLGLGIAHAYGNSSQVPYSEQFWVGGANSIRAFTVRSIGPGSYHDYNNRTDDYFDQTGTFKLEANVEYRFPIFGPLHGAVFLDAGNVWLLENDPQRPGGRLEAKSFLGDIALGTGAGLRFDISMLVIRGDLGIGIHAPWDTGRRGYYNMPSFKRSLAFHLAIGYPF